MPTCAARLSAEAGEGDKEFPLVLEEKVFNGRGRGFVIGNGKLQCAFTILQRKVLSLGEDLGGVLDRVRDGFAEREYQFCNFYKSDKFRFWQMGMAGLGD